MSKPFNLTYLFRMRTISKVFTFPTKPNLASQHDTFTHFKTQKHENSSKILVFRCLNDKNPAICLSWVRNL